MQETAQLIGGYRLESVLGAGGFAVVYKARQVDIDQVVAVKILHKLDASGIARFQREARTLATLQHVNISAAKRFDVVEDKAFLVSEYHDGKTLADALKAERMPEQRLINIFSQICDGLAHAHKAGIIHRDLKPSNILICAGDVVKIIDFGIAKNENEQSITSTGVFLGSPAYMSPEQYNGRVDQRSDIYSLGCLMYEALAGKLPFSGANAVNLLCQHLQEKPAAFGAQAGVSSDLEALVLKTLEKDPAQRYQSAEELNAALRAVQPGRKENQENGMKPRRAAKLIAVTLTIIVALFCMFMTHAADSADDGRELAALKDYCETNKNDRFASISRLAARYEAAGQFAEAEKVWKFGIEISPSVDEQAIFSCRLGLLSHVQHRDDEARKRFAECQRAAVGRQTKEAITAIVAAAENR